MSRLFLYCPTQQDGPGSKVMLEEECKKQPVYAREFLTFYSPLCGAAIPRLKFGDNTDWLKTPTLVKSRRIGDPNGVLLPFNKERHWGYNTNLSRSDIPFTQKKMAIVWRGATTGKSKHGFVFEEQPRTRLVRTWGPTGKPHKDIDVCYSEIIQGKRNKCKGMIGKHLTLKEQLRFALIVAVEGNDVATNLKWILASNSVPVMPPPRFESWLLESKLEPFVHYLPVRPDFADLPLVLEWARAHPLQCETMANAGKKYIKHHFPSAKMERAVIRRFLGLDPYNVIHPPRKDEQMRVKRAIASDRIQRAKKL